MHATTDGKGGTPDAAHAMDAFLREQVVVASRVLAHEGYADLTVGHVSVRDDTGRRMYIKRKGPSLAEIEPRDVLVHGIDDDASLSQVRDMHLESPMHTAIYRRRPDVGCVIHSHPMFATALSTTSGKLEMLAHDAIMFAEHGVPIFDDYDLLTDTESAERMAAALGPARAILLKGHGVVVVGQDARWAVHAALCLERAAKLQATARMLGELTPIQEELAGAFFTRKYGSDRAGDVDRPGGGTAFIDDFWAYWQRVARRSEGAVPRQI